MWRGHHAGSLPSGCMRLLGIEEGEGKAKQGPWGSIPVSGKPLTHPFLGLGLG